MYKLTKTAPSSLSDVVAEKHFETLKGITKFFTQKENNEYYLECAPYTPFLAWATQFYFLS